MLCAENLSHFNKPRVSPKAQCGYVLMKLYDDNAIFSKTDNIDVYLFQL